MLFYLLIFGYKHVLVVFLVNFCMCRLKARYPRTKAKFGLNQPFFEMCDQESARRYSQKDIAEVTVSDLREWIRRTQVAEPSEIELRAWTRKSARRYSQNDLAESTDVDLREGTRRRNSQQQLDCICDQTLRQQSRRFRLEVAAQLAKAFFTG